MNKHQKNQNILHKNGYIIKKFPDENLILNIEKVIKKFFYKKENYYFNLSIGKFHKIALKCQTALNRLEIQKKYDHLEKKFLKDIFSSDNLMYSVNLTLRVVRPSKYYLNNTNSSTTEALGWHRETFYGNHKHIQNSYNFWMPVLNYSKKISLNYIPNSHLISDNLIIRRKAKVLGNEVRKFSDSHKLGFPYSPKKIISGVDLSKAKKIFLPKKNYLLFSQMLVHGNGKNFYKKIRFAVNFSMVPESKLIRNKKINNKKFDFIDKSSSKLFVKF